MTESARNSSTKSKCTVQALVSQGISIALGCAFTTQPADQLFVSPRSRGSNLREYPDPCGNLTYRMMYSVFVRVHCSSRMWLCQEKHKINPKNQQNRKTMVRLICPDRRSCGVLFHVKNGNSSAAPFAKPHFVLIAAVAAVLLINGRSAHLPVSRRILMQA